MNGTEQDNSMKAIILAAGVGSRIRPLTDHCPKTLLRVSGTTILARMLAQIRGCGIREVVFILGYLEEQIREHVANEFPEIQAHYILNDRYAETNTGYSLMLARSAVGDSGFISFDADVVFDEAILQRLIDSPHEACLCVDKEIQLDAEEVKVVVDGHNRVLRASKSVDPSDAIGESIGIGKMGPDTARLLFSELEAMMVREENHREYYEAAYERLIEKGVPFHALDISGLRWTEIDTHEDFAQANAIF